MRIIKNGFEERPWKRKCSCKECKSHLEAEAADVQYEEWSDMAGDDEHAYFIRCPVCGFKVFIKDDLVPASIRAAAEKRFRGR